MRTEENFCRQFASEKVNFFRNLKKRIASLILHLLNYVEKCAMVNYGKNFPDYIPKIIYQMANSVPKFTVALFLP